MAKLTRKKAEEVLFELKKNNLREIARMFGLPVSGTKEELVSQILSNVKLSELSRVLAVEHDFKEGAEPKTKPKSKEINAQKLVKEITNLLKKIHPPKVKNEDELELYFLGLLQGKYASKKIEIIPQTITVTRGKTTQPDIVVGGVVAVELKYIRGADDSDRGIGQAFKYAKTYPYVILYYYDPQKRSHHSKSALGERIKLIIYPK